MNRKPAKRAPKLFDRVAAILEEARAGVVRTVNSQMVIAYWLIGREIVQEQQGGKKRAGYGDALLEDLSRRLTKPYGRGFSSSSLADFRRFHQVYAERLPEIFRTVRGELTRTSPSAASECETTSNEILHEARGESVSRKLLHPEIRSGLPTLQAFNPDLS